jgi:hypothetical protein
VWLSKRIRSAGSTPLSITPECTLARACCL